MAVHSKDPTFGERLFWLRKEKGISRALAAQEMGVGLSALQQYEGGAQPGPSNLAKLVDYYGCDKGWLITGTGAPFAADPPESEAGASAHVPHHPAAAILPGPVPTDSGIDPVIQAMSDIKDIFASGDPILIPAIQANLSAFKRALLRERQFAQVMQENRELKDRLGRLEAIIPEMAAKIETLQTENTGLKQEIQELKRHSGGCPPIALGLGNAALTGTDGSET